MQLLREFWHVDQTTDSADALASGSSTSGMDTDAANFEDYRDQLFQEIHAGSGPDGGGENSGRSSNLQRTKTIEKVGVTDIQSFPKHQHRVGCKLIVVCWAASGNGW